jgi:WD40 repeat protein
MLTAAALAPSRLLAASSGTTLTRDAMGVLREECLVCHNPEKKKGGLVMATREALLKGGDGGTVVEPGKPDNSRLLQLLRKEADPHMPPRRQLPESQVRVLRDWIQAGLPWDAAALQEAPAPLPVALEPMPAAYHPVSAMALSPDGRRLAIARGGWIVLHDTGSTNYPVLARVEAHTDAVQALSWSADGRWLASGGFRRVAVWDGTNLEPARTWTRGLVGRVTAVAFAPDGRSVVAGDGVPGQSGHVRELRLEGDPSPPSWRAHSDLIYDLAFSRDGRRLVTASGDRMVRVWDAATHREIALLEGHSAQVLTVAFNTNATQVVSGAADKELRVWDIATREKLTALGRHVAGFTGVQWPGDGRNLFAVSDDGGVFRFSQLQAHTGEQSSGTGQEQQIGELPDAALCVAVVTNDLRVFVGCQDGSVHVLKGEGGRLAILSPGEPGPARVPAASVPTPLLARNTATAGAPNVGGARLADSRRRVPIADLTASPAELHLTAASPRHGLLITARGEDGFERDVTREVRWVPGSASPFEVELGGVVRGVRVGRGTLEARLEGRRVVIPVFVEPGAPGSGSASLGTAPLSFVRDVLPALSKAGCNAGACHAKPEGQNGFKLTVFSYDPRLDHTEIVKEARGRRVFPAAPDESLLILKPTLGLPHEGGQRFEKGSETHALLVRWIREGMTFTVTNEAPLQGIAVFPSARRYPKGSTQRLLVQARYADGTVRDVTPLAAFLSSDKEIARVDESGEIRVGSLTGQGVVVARYMGYVADSQVLVPADRLFPLDDYAALPRNNFIDDLAYAHFQELGLLPSDLCTDAEFIRRVKLDAVGLLPGSDEVRAFLADPAPDKRRRYIARVLEDPAYADYWANKWADLLRPNPDRVGVKSIFTLDQWLRESFRANKPYDRFVREILLAEGCNHREGPAVVYRDRREPVDLTTMFSQLFLGTRFECARCHHHPNEKWSQDDFYRFAAFFGPLKQKGAGLSPPISAGMETFFFTPGGGVRHPVSGALMPPRAPEGPELKLADTVDPRVALADWLTDPSNPFFARAAVNRVWGALFGRGLVEPVDDFRISNPCVNPALLAAVAEDFARQGYNLKRLLATLMESRLYQLSTTPNDSNLADTRNFSRAYRRRLPAEVLLDAVNDITGIPDTFAAMPSGSRAMQTWSYKIDSQFMDAFGRPNSSSDCPCERDLQTSVVQSLHMMHAKGLQSKLSNPGGRVHQLAAGGLSPEQVVTELYLAALGRPPSARELGVALAPFSSPGATRQSATEDVLWALLNSAEFVFNH